MPRTPPETPTNHSDAPGTHARLACKAIPKFYAALRRRLGPQKWWPAETQFEVIVGAILTQNTTWKNVEKAIENLRREGLLDPARLEHVRLPRLERLVRPSGYFRQKARKLKAFLRFLKSEFGGSLERMFRAPTAELRKKLLGVRGIGPETADAILLYAGQHPVFVIDAYTRRILARHAVADVRASYDDVQTLFHSYLPREAALFNQYHALLVAAGKRWCRTRGALCAKCPLGRFLEQAR